MCGVGGGGGVESWFWGVLKLRGCASRRLLLGSSGMRRWTGISGYLQINRGARHAHTVARACTRVSALLLCTRIHSYR
jgi:hypothetical protein